MEWGGEFRAADKGLGLLLSGKISGRFDGNMPSERWAALRVAIINGFNDVITMSRDSLAEFDDLTALSDKVTASLTAEIESLGGQGRVVVEVVDLDEQTQAVVEKRRAQGIAVPDAFLIGASNMVDGGVGPPPPAPPPGVSPDQFTAGGNVLVRWSDGNQYPGRVIQVSVDQCLVALSDGREMWLGLEWLIPV